MNKKITFILLSFLLVSCNSNNEQPSSESQVASNEESEISSLVSSEELSSESIIEESSESIEEPSIEDSSEEIEVPKANFVTIINEGDLLYSLVVEDLSDTAKQYVDDFNLKWQSETGTTLNVVNSKETETPYEIIVGKVDKRSESTYILNQLTPTGYCVREADGKIVVTGYEDLAIYKCLEHLFEVVAESRCGKFTWGIDENYEYYGDCYMDTYVPKLVDSTGKYEKTYYAGDGYYQLCYNNSKYQDMHKYMTLLEDNGFEYVSENEIGFNYFFTYQKDDAMVTLAYYHNAQRLYVVYGKNNYLPSLTADNETKLVDSSITHIKRNGSAQSSPGLSIVCQLIDGSYIIVDGGPTDSTDEAYLLKFLQDNNPNPTELPKVRWFFTHAHHDHMSLAVSFLNKYHDKIDIELFAYNFPDFNTLDIPSEPDNRIQDSKDLIAEFDEVYNKYYSDSEIYKFHAGDRLALPGCIVETYLTHETFYPQEFSWINHTSSAFKITIGNKSLLVLGDCEQTVCEYLAKLYEDSIKSDILQVTHHGLNGGSISLYSYVKPEICFWAIDKTRFETSDMCLGTKWGFEYNAWLRDEANGVKEHYHASDTTTIYCENEESNT